MPTFMLRTTSIDGVYRTIFLTDYASKPLETVQPLKVPITHLALVAVRQFYPLHFPPLFGRGYSLCLLGSYWGRSETLDRCILCKCPMDSQGPSLCHHDP